jgi:hypothetical protein
VRPGRGPAPAACTRVAAAEAVALTEPCPSAPHRVLLCRGPLEVAAGPPRPPAGFAAAGSTQQVLRHRGRGVPTNAAPRDAPARWMSCPFPARPGLRSHPCTSRFQSNSNGDGYAVTAPRFVFFTLFRALAGSKMQVRTGLASALVAVACVAGGTRCERARRRCGW